MLTARLSGHCVKWTVYVSLAPARSFSSLFKNWFFSGQDSTVRDTAG